MIYACSTPLQHTPQYTTPIYYLCFCTFSFCIYIYIFLGVFVVFFFWVVWFFFLVLAMTRNNQPTPKSLSFFLLCFVFGLVLISLLLHQLQLYDSLLESERLRLREKAREKERKKERKRERGLGNPKHYLGRELI